MLSNQDTKALIASSNLPHSIIKLITLNIYTYTFETKEELQHAIKNYPQNIDTYGNSLFWDVSKVTDMSNLFIDTDFKFLSKQF